MNASTVVIDEESNIKPNPSPNIINMAINIRDIDCLDNIRSIWIEGVNYTGTKDMIGNITWKKSDDAVEDSPKIQILADNKNAGLCDTIKSPLKKTSMDRANKINRDRRTKELQKVFPQMDSSKINPFLKMPSGPAPRPPQGPVSISRQAEADARAREWAVGDDNPPIERSTSIVSDNDDDTSSGVEYMPGEGAAGGNNPLIVRSASVVSDLSDTSSDNEILLPPPPPTEQTNPTEQVVGNWVKNASGKWVEKKGGSVRNKKNSQKYTKKQFFKKTKTKTKSQRNKHTKKQMHKK